MALESGKAQISVPNPGSGKILPPKRSNRAVPRSQSGRITEPHLVKRARGVTGFRKRIIDLFGAIVALAFFSPLFATVVIACLIATGRLPFTHATTVGLRGALFQRWTLVAPPAEAKGHLAGMLRSLFRSSSVARLPELWHVISGKMSLVGPAPLAPDGVVRYGAQRRFYLLAKPGLVSLWEVRAPASSAWERRVECDRDYIERWTFLRDGLILALRVLRLRARL